jgi:hypothetical protein
MSVKPSKEKKDMQNLSKGTPFYPHKFTREGKVSLLYSPWRDARVPKMFFDGKSFTDEGKTFLSSNDIHGYRDITMEEAHLILQNTKQFFRPSEIDMRYQRK